jgi:hypothetical protein
VEPLFGKCEKGQTVKWNGVTWGCAADENTTQDLSSYAKKTELEGLASQGLVDSLSKTVKMVNDMADGLQKDLSTKTVEPLFGKCEKGQTVKWNGVTWGCAADENTTQDLSGLASKSSVEALSKSLAPVATSGKYTDLTNTPTLSTVATSGSYNDLTSKPNLSALASKSLVDGL